MAKVKEFIKEMEKHYKNTFNSIPPYQVLGLIEEFKIIYKNEIAEKDKEISKLKQDVADLECNQYVLEAKQLYKEDFYDLNAGELTQVDNVDFWDRMLVLKDNSKYDKLPSKDVK